MPVVGLRLRMHKHPVYLRTFQLQPVFERCDDIMHAMHRQRVGKRAVAGEVQVISHARYGNLVDVDDLWQRSRHTAQLLLQTTVLLDAVGCFDGGGFAFNVRQHVAHFRRGAVHLLFQLTYKAMCLHQRQRLVNLNVLLDMQAIFVLLHAEVVQGYVVERGHAADAIEDVFPRYLTRARCGW